MARIVIPGGSGYLGRSIGAELVARGDEVVVFSRGAPKTQDGIRYITWDGNSLGDWVTELEGADAIIHLTGQRVDTRATKKNIDELINSRVQPVRVVGEALKTLSQPPKVWVQSSSLAIYGDGGEEIIDESFTPTGLGPREMVTVCLAWEHAFSIASAGVERPVILRTGIGIGGPGDPASKKLVGIVKMGLGGKVGNGQQWISWIDLRDLIRIFLRAIDNPEMSGVYHATAPTPERNVSMMQHYQSAVGAQRALSSPKPLVILGAPILGSSASLGLTGRRCVPARLLEEGFEFEFTSMERSVKDAVANL